MCGGLGRGGEDVRSEILKMATWLKSTCCVCGLSVIFASPKK